MSGPALQTLSLREQRVTMPRFLPPPIALVCFLPFRSVSSFLLSLSPTCLPMPIYLPAYLSAYLHACLPTHLPTYVPACLCVYLPTCLPAFISASCLFFFILSFSALSFLISIVPGIVVPSFQCALPSCAITPQPLLSLSVWFPCDVMGFLKRWRR